jgi:sterol desaturase/sphingolipid hydroxylase (fatty acid hydroxylase superfamily)
MRMIRFSLTRPGYYLDFVTTPLVVAALIWLSWGGIGVRWALAVLLGLLAWTLAEYLIHRFVLHRHPLRAYHDVHHARPSGYVGVPSWIVALAHALLAAALYVATGVDGFGGMAGYLLGYLSYIAVHDAFHHRSIRPGSLLYAAKLRHVQHHRGLEANYGVVFPVWDIVFRTYSSAEWRPPR